MKVWLQEKGAEPCGPFQLRGLLRPCHLPSLPCRLCPCLCFPKSVASVLCHLGPLGLSLPLLPSQPLFAALPLSSALFVHLSSSSPFLFVFLAFSLLPRLGFPSNERVPGKEGSLRPWKSPADPAPSCDLPACPQLLPLDPPEASLLKMASPGCDHPSLADPGFPGGLRFGQLGERSRLMEEGLGSLRASNWVFRHEGQVPRDLRLPSHGGWSL